MREQWWIILLCVVLTTFAAAVYTSTQKKEYQASAKLLLQPDNLSTTIAGTGVPGVDPNRQAATDAQLVVSPTVTGRVRKRLANPARPLSVKAKTDADSNIMTITVTDHDPKRAAKYADGYAQEFIAFRRQMARTRYTKALKTVEARLVQTRPSTSEFAILRAQVRQLKLLVSLQTGDAQVVQDATAPKSAVSPKPQRNITLGVIFGLLLGCGLAFLRDRLDRRVKNEDQLKTLLPDVPIVGLVPEPRRSRASRLMTGEGYHNLRANLSMLSHDHPSKTILVTSASPGEGKSTVAVNLALAMIQKGQSALVLDADLRRPSLTERLKADRTVGVSSILTGDGTLATSVQERPVGSERNGDGPTVALDGELPFVAAGPAAANVQLLFNERSLGLLIEAARERSEAVIFDGPPVGSFADMLPLAKEVDAVILVVRLYHSRVDQWKRFSAQLANAGIRPIGVVVLGAATGPSRYYSQYLSKR